MFSYLFIGAICFISSYSLTPIVINFANRRKIFDTPNHRKKHITPIPRIGGISLIASMSICLFILLIFLKNDFALNPLEVLTIYICYLSFFFIGIFDDLRSLSPFIRLFFQFIISTISFYGIAKFQGFYFSLNYSNYFLPLGHNLISFFFTVIWTVGVINAINWIDGVDGLLIGLTCIYSFTFALISFLNNNYFELILSTGMLSACLGIIKYNKNPAKIMLGDGGSYLIGIYLSSTILNIGQDNGIVNPFLLVSLVFIPVIDMFRVICLRIWNGFSPFYPDRKHLHYVLIDNGISKKNCLLIFFFISFLFSIFNLIINL